MKEKWGYQTKHTQTRSKKPFQAKLRKKRAGGFDKQKSFDWFRQS
jgi:hypothetical protein